MMRSQVPCWTQVGSKSVKQRNCLELGACSQLSTLKGVEGRVEAPGWDQEEGQALVTYSNLHQTNQQVGQFTFQSTFGARTSHGQPWTHKIHHNPDSGGSHHLPPYSILCVSLRHLHLNGFLSQDSKGGVLKLSQFGLLRLCEFITLCSDL